ncbi:hypothetical protein GCK72_007842 [Caenorhabditis remanei]|uniref:Uncharacterized protein n=1 Tax=Caenorhabditis remanei TaxID=31234 RepID=A0A6A5HNE9_CAERE|nr:hypothetical protein GCK72_007842 [Caenorhabditis remanei]KAF1767883.1 hypothetical protein GCK72_007842 [Caenorhabditis remanei]
MDDVDMIMASLENGIASTGGFCVGRSFVVGHQRLSGLGYCFSASLPPLLATAASEAIAIIDEQPERVQRVTQISIDGQRKLETALKNTKFMVQACPESPMKHLYYEETDETVADRKLNELVEKVFEENRLLVTRARYLDKEEIFKCRPRIVQNGNSVCLVTRARYLDKEEIFKCRPSIRVMFQYDLTEEEINRAVEAIGAAARQL